MKLLSSSPVPRSALLSVTALCALLSACGSETPVPATADTPPPSSTAPAAPQASASPASPPDEPAAPAQPAHRFLMQTAACWFGGLWGDALGEPADARKAADEARCHEIVKQVYGNEDQGHYERLRAVDPGEVDRLVMRIEGLAKSTSDESGRQEALVKTVKALAAAQAENVAARRAADKVRHDIKDGKEPQKLSSDEAAAVAPLKAQAGLAALLGLDAGDLTAEAHALGVLSALDRMEIAARLPKHLKIYAATPSNALLFQVQPPAVPEDSSKPLKPGVWLGYVSDVAKAAGHPVSDKVKTPAEREPLAWNGALAGYADKLHQDAEKIGDTTDLKKVVVAVAKRLDAQLADAQSAAATPPAPAGKAPAGKAPAGKGAAPKTK